MGNPDKVAQKDRVFRIESVRISSEEYFPVLVITADASRAAKQKALEAQYVGVQRNQWARDDREAYNQNAAEIAGVKASYNELAAEYNAKMAEVNWRFANVTFSFLGTAVAGVTPTLTWTPPSTTWNTGTSGPSTG